MWQIVRGKIGIVKESFKLNLRNHFLMTFSLINSYAEPQQPIFHKKKISVLLSVARFASESYDQFL